MQSIRSQDPLMISAVNKTPIQSVASASRNAHPEIYIRFTNWLAGSRLSLFKGRTWTDQVIYAAPVVICSIPQGISFCFQLTIYSPVVFLGFQRVNLSALAIESD